MARVDRPGRVDRASRGDERLPGHLPAEHPLAPLLRAAAAEQVDLERLEIEELDQVVERVAARRRSRRRRVRHRAASDGEHRVRLVMRDGYGRTNVNGHVDPGRRPRRAVEPSTEGVRPAVETNGPPGDAGGSDHARGSRSGTTAVRWRPDRVAGRYPRSSYRGRGSRRPGHRHAGAATSSRVRRERGHRLVRVRRTGHQSARRRRRPRRTRTVPARASSAEHRPSCRDAVRRDVGTASTSCEPAGRDARRRSGSAAGPPDVVSGAVATSRCTRSRPRQDSRATDVASVEPPDLLVARSAGLGPRRRRSHTGRPRRSPRTTSTRRTYASRRPSKLDRPARGRPPPDACRAPAIVDGFDRGTSGTPCRRKSGRAPSGRRPSSRSRSPAPYPARGRGPRSPAPARSRPSVDDITTTRPSLDPGHDTRGPGVRRRDRSTRRHRPRWTRRR